MLGDMLKSVKGLKSISYLYNYAVIAQLVVRRTCNAKVASSILANGSFIFFDFMNK